MESVQRRIKCKVFRAEDPNDMADIYAEDGDTGVRVNIQAGQLVDLPEDAYNILKMAEEPAQKVIEVNGKKESVSYMRPRFNISIEGIETKTETDTRVSQLALQQGKTIDVLTDENEKLKKELAKLKKDAVLSDSK